MEAVKNKNYFWIFLLLLAVVGIILAVVFLTSSGTSISGANDNIISSNIIGNFEISLTADAVNFDSYINTAINTWSNIITNFNVIPITFRVDNTSGNVLAYAYMNNPSNIFGGGVVTLGANIINPTGGWANIIEHEIGHVLGIGASRKWESAIRMDGGGNRTLNRSIFPNSGTAYDNLINDGKITGTVGGNIPLSDANDLGHDDGGDHWDELIFDEELMTPITDTIMPLSSLSIAALKDLGFAVDETRNEDDQM